MFEQFLHFRILYTSLFIPSSHLTSERRTANIYEFRLILFPNDPLATFNDTFNWREDHGIRHQLHYTRSHFYSV